MAGLFRSRGSDRTPVRVETITPPAELPAMHESALFDLHDRRTKAVALIQAALVDERAELSRTARNVLLDVRNALIEPEPIEPEPLPLRPSVPVIPGRAS